MGFRFSVDFSRSVSVIIWSLLIRTRYVKVGTTGETHHTVRECFLPLKVYGKRNTYYTKENWICDVGHEKYRNMQNHKRANQNFKRTVFFFLFIINFHFPFSFNIYVYIKMNTQHTPQNKNKREKSSFFLYFTRLSCDMFLFYHIYLSFYLSIFVEWILKRFLPERSSKTTDFFFDRFRFSVSE